jgi:hypothetical protein
MEKRRHLSGGDEQNTGAKEREIFCREQAVLWYASGVEIPIH